MEFLAITKCDLKGAAILRKKRERELGEIVLFHLPTVTLILSCIRSQTVEKMHYAFQLLPLSFLYFVVFVLMEKDEKIAR